MADSADVVHYGEHTWTRMRSRESRWGRTAEWFFRADSPAFGGEEDDDDDAILRSGKEMASELAYQGRVMAYKTEASTCEEQSWTVFIPAGNSLNGKVACKDYVLICLARDMSKKCSAYHSFTTTVEVNLGSFRVRVIDKCMRDDRRDRQCADACLALLCMGRIARGSMRSFGYKAVAKLLWKTGRASTTWDKMFDSGLGPRKRLKTL